MKYKQTDEYFEEQINKYGCLFFQHMNIAELHTGHCFIYRTIMKLYFELTKKTFISNGKEYLLMEKNCYVNSHIRVLQEALECFGNHEKVTYVGAWYNDKQSKRESWGERFGMYMILQMRTKNGNGHFTSMHYDSYMPLIKFTNLISVRYYNIGI